MYQNPYKTVGLASFFLPGTATGEILYVDDVSGDDDDANLGIDPMSPLLTITEALTRCSAGSNDYIIVLNYGTNPANDATWPISVNMDNVQIIAAQCGSFTKTMTTIAANGNFSCLSIAAHNVRVQGFRFLAGAAGAGVTFAGSHGEIAIFDCNFEGRTYGVYSPAGGVGWGLEVSRCIFTAQSSHGIFIDDDPGTCRYANNTFTLTVDNSVGIEVTSGGNDQILDNRFSTKDGTPVHGWGITMSGNATDALITGNEAMLGIVVPNPTAYKDTTAAGTCNWGINYNGTSPIYAT